LFDLEGPDTWCLTFEKADLASQIGDWDQVVTLGDDARKQSLKAGDPSEMFVFLEGYLRAGQIETALEVSQEMSIESEGLLDDEICTLWTLIQSETGIELSPGLDLYCQP
jgi:pentatricopeptide repeat protein